ncbi:MAG: hypothetical protein ACYC6F_17270 [Longimicrobiales bacterium]
MTAPARGLEALFALPESAQVPAGWVRGLIEDSARARIVAAADREDTIAMYCELATRHLTTTPEEIPTGAGR